MKGSRNVEFVGGDMFESIPSAQIIPLKRILHDWNDEECVKILKNYWEVLLENGVQGKVMIIAVVVNENNGNHEMAETQLYIGVLMMAVTNGKERTEAEWEKLFLDTGFQSYNITHGLGLRSIIEVFP